MGGVSVGGRDEEGGGASVDGRWEEREIGKV